MDAKGGLLYGGSIENMDLLADYGIDRTERLLNSLKKSGPGQSSIVDWCDPDLFM